MGPGIWIQGVKKAPYPWESDPQNCFFLFIDSAFLTFQVLSELEQLDEEARFENGVLSSFYWVSCVCWMEHLPCDCAVVVQVTCEMDRSSAQFLKVIGSDFHASYS